MSTVTVSKDVNAYQLGQELDAGIMVRADDAAGTVEIDAPDVDEATLAAAVDDHVADPSVRPPAQVRDDRLVGAIATLRQWADDAEATTATQGNAVQVLNVVVDRLGVFFDRFADLLDNQYVDSE